MFKFATLVFIGAVSAFSQNQDNTFLAGENKNKTAPAKKAEPHLGAGAQTAKLAKKIAAALKAKQDEYDANKKAEKKAVDDLAARYKKAPFDVLESDLKSKKEALAQANQKVTDAQKAVDDLKKDADDKDVRTALEAAQKKALKAKNAVEAAQTKLDNEKANNGEIKALKNKLKSATDKVNGERPVAKKGENSWAAVKRIVGEEKALYRDLPKKMSALGVAEMKKEVGETALEHAFWKKVVAAVEAADKDIVAWKNKTNKLLNETAAAKAFAAAQEKLHTAEVAYLKLVENATKINATQNVTNGDKKALDLAVASFETSCAKATVLLAKGMWSHADTEANKTQLYEYLQQYKKRVDALAAAEKKAADADKKGGAAGAGTDGKKTEGGSSTWIWIALAVVVAAAVGLFFYTKGCPNKE